MDAVVSTDLSALSVEQLKLAFAAVAPQTQRLPDEPPPPTQAERLHLFDQALGIA